MEEDRGRGVLDAEEPIASSSSVDVPSSSRQWSTGNTLGSSPVTMLSSSPNLRSSTLDEIGRHNMNPEANPLHSPWTFWFENSPRKESPGDFGLKKLCEVKNIKAFWGVVNNINPVPKLQERTGYHLMRGDVVPTWEGNLKGGYWSLMCRKDRTQDVWTEILLASVGEQLSETVAEDDDVVGVSVRIRDREDMIQIWNRNASMTDKAKVMDKVKELCSDVEFKEKYISCRGKMNWQQPPPPKNLQSMPFLPGPGPWPGGFAHPVRFARPPPPMGNFPPAHPPGLYQQHGFQPGPHPGSHSGLHYPGTHSGPGPLSNSHPVPNSTPNPGSHTGSVQIQSHSRNPEPEPRLGEKQ